MNIESELDLNSLRARKSRLAAFLSKTGGPILPWVGIILGIAAGLVLLTEMNTRLAYGGLSLALLSILIGLWYSYDLKQLPMKSPAQSLDDIIEQQLLASFRKGTPISPRLAWQSALETWEGRFMVSHLLLPADQIEQTLTTAAADMPACWQEAQRLAADKNQTELHSGLVMASLLRTPKANELLAKQNLTKEDVLETADWLKRLRRESSAPRPHFGGIGRDWASGFTPLLDRFGQNISAFVEAGHGHFHTLAHADVMESITHSLSQPSGSVAVVGPAGSGKTSLVYALAERLLSGEDKGLLYYQIISLNASAILSAAADKLEKIILRLFSEAQHAKNVIIFLDEAELFFGKGTGAFDASQILLPVIEDQSIKLIAAFTPESWQQLKSEHQSLATHISPIIISEPDEKLTIQILEDTALTLETQYHIVVSYQAVREAYRLSGQYMQDLSYPGKAISLLEQALPYLEGQVMTAQSVQAAVEKTQGVKVATPAAPEADELLNLEDRIHGRMINQERAVSVVAAALRRGRSGVADPRRPVGSFLFLGPTGVGKTELARSLADAYFGNEQQMIRLDMTEYQQSEDVDRLLEVGGSNDKSLILRIREQPFSVVLLDEVEKANHTVLNLLLQMLDEGQLTDKTGRPASFRNTIIIATSNAGSAEIAQRVAAGDSLDQFERPLIDKLISGGQFKAELINRFDNVVLFRPLNQSELAQVAQLMLGGVNKNLAKQNIKVQLTDAALAKLIQAGYDPQFGARPMRRVIQASVEDIIASKILRGEAQPGSTISLDAQDLSTKIPPSAVHLRN